MGSIETKIDVEKDLTINICTGKLTLKEVQDTIDSYYSKTITRLVLWDVTNADVSQLNAAELKKIVVDIRERSTVRVGGKTALLFSKDVGYGIGRMLMAFSDSEGLSIDLMVFREPSKAHEWLGI